MQRWTTDWSDGYQKNVVEFYPQMKPLLQCLKREGLKTVQRNICFSCFFVAFVAQNFEAYTNTAQISTVPVKIMRPVRLRPYNYCMCKLYTTHSCQSILIQTMPSFTCSKEPFLVLRPISDADLFV